MQSARRTGTIVAAVAALLVPLAVRAQSTGRSQETVSGADSAAAAARAEALANVEANRGAVISETVERWRSELGRAVPSLNIDGGEAQLVARLQRASADKLLAASQAQTYEEVVSLLRRGEGPSVIPLAPGSPIPHVFGDSSDDLVFTPVTPCRIIDTRFATGGFAGKIGPNSGKEFFDNLTDYTPQGGSNTNCGLPTAFEVSAVAINVTSAGQTGVGNIRVVECGGGLPTASLLNYTPGVNLANAAVVRSAIGCGVPGGGNIFIYSGNSATDVIVDIMGYLAAPVVTALDCYTTAATTQAVAAGANFGIAPPACAAGFFQSSVGCRSQSYNSANWAITGYYVPGTSDGSCWGTNITGGTLNYQAFGRCCRVPGR